MEKVVLVKEGDSIEDLKIEIKKRIEDNKNASKKLKKYIMSKSYDSITTTNASQIVTMNGVDFIFTDAFAGMEKVAVSRYTDIGYSFMYDPVLDYNKIKDLINNHRGDDYDKHVKNAATSDEHSLLVVNNLVDISNLPIMNHKSLSGAFYLYNRLLRFAHKQDGVFKKYIFSKQKKFRVVEITDDDVLILKTVDYDPANTLDTDDDVTIEISDIDKYKSEIRFLRNGEIKDSYVFDLYEYIEDDEDMNESYMFKIIEI